LAQGDVGTVPQICVSKKEDCGGHNAVILDPFEEGILAKIVWNKEWRRK